MNQQELMRLMPHRPPMLLLDEAEAKEDGTAAGQYLVKGDEWFLQGHFPGNPVVPGVVLCEMLAQTCCVLAARDAGGGKTPLFTGLDKVRFRTPVRPGDVLHTRCRITRQKGPFTFAEGEGRVGERLAVAASFSFALVGEEG